MIKIPNQYTKYNYEFKLMKRIKGVALYSQAIKGEIVGYEVHKIRVFDNTECLAKTSEFGSHAWSYTHLVNAEKKYKELE